MTRSNVVDRALAGRATQTVIISKVLIFSNSTSLPLPSLCTASELAQSSVAFLFNSKYYFAYAESGAFVKIIISLYISSVAFHWRCRWAASNRHAKYKINNLKTRTIQIF